MRVRLELNEFDDPPPCSEEMEKRLHDPNEMRVDRTRELWEIFLQFFLTRSYHEDFAIGDDIGCDDFILYGMMRRRLGRTEEEMALLKAGKFPIAQEGYADYPSEVVRRDGKKPRIVGDYRWPRHRRESEATNDQNAESIRGNGLLQAQPFASTSGMDARVKGEE